MRYPSSLIPHPSSGGGLAEGHCSESVDAPMKLFKYIWRNATRNRLRSFLTILSVGFSLAMLTVLYGYLAMQKVWASEAEQHHRIVVMNSQGFSGKVPIAYVDRVARTKGSRLPSRMPGSAASTRMNACRSRSLPPIHSSLSKYGTSSRSIPSSLPPGRRTAPPASSTAVSPRNAAGRSASGSRCRGLSIPSTSTWSWLARSTRPGRPARSGSIGIRQRVAQDRQPDPGI